MNNLEREIKVGEWIVMSAAIFHKPNLPPDGRMFICHGGYGMHMHTSGSKISGQWADGSGWDLIDATWIDVAETNALHQRVASAAARPTDSQEGTTTG